MTQKLEIPRTLLRIGAGSSILAGLLLPVGFLLHPAGEDAIFGTDPFWVPAHAVLWIAFTLAVLGWIGVYLGHASQAGKLGLISFIVIIIGTAVASWIFSSDVTFVPVIAAEAPQLFERIFTTPHLILGGASVLTWVLGNVLFGVSVLRTRVYPPWTGLLLIVGIVVIPVCYYTGVSVKVIALAGAIVGAGQVVLGYHLLRLIER